MRPTCDIDERERQEEQPEGLEQPVRSEFPPDIALCVGILLPSHEWGRLIPTDANERGRAIDAEESLGRCASDTVNAKLEDLRQSRPGCTGLKDESISQKNVASHPGTPLR